MKIEILETRNYSGIGLKHAGETAEVSDDLGGQLIRQGIAKTVVEKKQTKNVEHKED